jgi:hypothetical protein
MIDIRGLDSTETLFFFCVRKDSLMYSRVFPVSSPNCIRSTLQFSSRANAFRYHSEI